MRSSINPQRKLPPANTERGVGQQDGGPDESLLCANCGLEISWPPAVVDGNSYCCGGCALGGPCYCSYDSIGAAPSLDQMQSRSIRVGSGQDVVPTETSAGVTAVGTSVRNLEARKL